jgi:23S rRNA (uracil1939-C5)-methyltransferase
VTLERLAWGGRAVGKTPDGKVVFVSKAVPGDRVLARLDRQKSRYGEGRIHAVLSPSPDRVEPRCKFFSHCGGCQWLCVAPARQRSEKEVMLRWSLREHLEDLEPEPLAWGETDLGYRHRGEFHVHPTGGSILIGFHQEATHKVINLDVCPLFSRRFNGVYGEVRGRLKSFAGAAQVGRVILSASEAEDAFVAHFHLRRGTSRAEAEALAGALAGAGLMGLLATIDKAPGDPLLEQGETRLSYTVEAPGPEGPRVLALRVGVRSFTQAHYALNRDLVTQAMRWLALRPGERLLDLYAGAGNFSAPAATLCGAVTAVEESPWACADGVANADRLGLDHLLHLRGDAGAVASELVEGGERFDAALLDPPPHRCRGSGSRPWAAPACTNRLHLLQFAHPRPGPGTLPGSGVPAVPCTGIRPLPTDLPPRNPLPPRAVREWKPLTAEALFGYLPPSGRE